MNTKKELPTRKILFYNYIAKRITHIKNSEDPEEIEDFLLEILDFIWESLNETERNYINPK